MICMSALGPEMTDERFASIFEQSTLIFLSVESMLFLRDWEAEPKCIAHVILVAQKLQGREEI